MPLSAPVPRERAHARSIACRGYLRGDGWWDIEGTLVDSKTYPQENDWRGELPPGDPIHDMAIRLTLDEDFQVRAVEVATDKTPYPICGNVTPNFQRLVGLSVKSGWRKALREHLGGTDGCTHLVELLGAIGTVAFQTIYPYRRSQMRRTLQPGEPDREDGPPRQLDTCHAWDRGSEVVLRYNPQYYTDDSSVETPARPGQREPEE